MKTIHKLVAATSLALLSAAPALAQHSHGGGGSHSGGGYHGGGGNRGGYGGGGFHRGYAGGYHGSYRGGYNYHGGYGWRGGYGRYGYGADAFTFGLLSGYALGGPWGYSYYPRAYYYDYAPPPPPADYYERAPSGDVVDGSDMQPADDGKHCPLYWDGKTSRYEPHCG